MNGDVIYRDDLNPCREPIRGTLLLVVIYAVTLLCRRKLVFVSKERLLLPTGQTEDTLAKIHIAVSCLKYYIVFNKYMHKVCMQQ